jgi:hypothetical protein
MRENPILVTFRPPFLVCYCLVEFLYGIQSKEINVVLYRLWGNNPCFC